MPQLTQFTVRCLRHVYHHRYAYSKAKHRYHPDYVFPIKWKIRADASAGVRELRTNFDRRGRPASYRPEPRDIIVIPAHVRSYEWTIEEKRSGNYVPLKTIRHRNCIAEFNVPTLMRSQADFRITLAIHFNTGNPQTSSKEFVLQEFLIVSIGDSFASGEGNPDDYGHDQQLVPKPSSPYYTCVFGKEAAWHEPRAHRSLRSGPSFAALSLERKNHQTPDGNKVVFAVTYLTFATSGAKLPELVDKKQYNWQSGPQIEEVRYATAGRTIDALMISIGGNDSGFANTLGGLMFDTLDDLAVDFVGDLDDLTAKFKVAAAALVLTKGPLVPLAAAALMSMLRNDSLARHRVREEAEEAIARLRDVSYPRLASMVDNWLSPRAVFISEYPVGLFDDDNGESAPGCGIFNIGSLEVDQADAQVTKELGNQLNIAISNAVLSINRDGAVKAPWHFVSGIADGFAGHGYCSLEPYFRHLDESFSKQCSPEGVMHPNIPGCQEYAASLHLAIFDNVMVHGPSPRPVVAQIWCAPNPIRFAGVTVGETKAKTLTITNQSSGMVNVNFAKKITPPFLWPQCNKFLDPGEKVQLRIEFIPTSRGPHADEIEVGYYATDRPDDGKTMTIKLQGSTRDNSPSDGGRDRDRL